MKKNNNNVFLKKVFERSNNPIEQLLRIQNSVPMFFAKPNVAKTINEHLTSFGYELNNDFVGIYKMAGHSACGEASSQERNTGHSACGDIPCANNISISTFFLSVNWV